MNDYTVIGTCSLCGGPVQVPTVLMSIVPPVPTCGKCGATKRAHGPVIEMEPRRTTTTNSLKIEVNNESKLHHGRAD